MLSCTTTFTVFKPRILKRSEFRLVRLGIIYTSLSACARARERIELKAAMTPFIRFFLPHYVLFRHLYLCCLKLKFLWQNKGILLYVKSYDLC